VVRVGCGSKNERLAFKLLELSDYRLRVGGSGPFNRLRPLFDHSVTEDGIGLRHGVTILGLIGCCEVFDDGSWIVAEDRHWCWVPEVGEIGGRIEPEIAGHANVRKYR